MQGISEQNKIAESIINQTRNVFGNKIGLFVTLFGCWHKELSRPFTIGQDSYRACLDCGARKQFDTENLRTFGAFHYPPTVLLDRKVDNN